MTHSKPGALPVGAFSEALEGAALALMSAVEEFERKTGRTVDGIHLRHIDVTNLVDTEAIFEREAGLSWLPTVEEEEAAERADIAWKAYFKGEGPRPC